MTGDRYAHEIVGQRYEKGCSFRSSYFYYDNTIIGRVAVFGVFVMIAVLFIYFLTFLWKFMALMGRNCGATCK